MMASPMAVAIVTVAARPLTPPKKHNLGTGFGNGGIVQPAFQNSGNSNRKYAQMYSSSAGTVRYNGLLDTMVTVKEEGLMALMRGAGVRCWRMPLLLVSVGQLMSYAKIFDG